MAFNETREFSERFRVMVVGDKRVGKTSLVSRFIDGSFTEDRKTPKMDDRRSKTVEVEGRRVKLQVVDAMSREWHLSVDTMDFRRADAIFICFDVTNLSSFRDTQYWPNRIGETEEFELALVANKCDNLSARVVTSEMGEAQAKELGASYYETSAKTAGMVDEVFHATVSHLLSRCPRRYSDNWDTITLDDSPSFCQLGNEPSKRRKRCC